MRHLHALRKALDKQIDQEGLRQVTALEMALIPVVVDIEAAGLRIDTAELNHQIDKASRASQEAREKLRSLSSMPDLNPNSPPQVKAMLREQGLDLLSTDKDALAPHLGREVVVKLLEFRKQSKLASTLRGLYNALGDDGRVRASFDPLGTCTGRFSSSDPCLQNLPRGAPRTIFKPSEGCRYVRADFSQIELRIAAALTGEDKMLAAFRANKDLHCATAAFVTGKEPTDVTLQERQEAKAVNFGFLYGQGRMASVRRLKLITGWI